MLEYRLGYYVGVLVVDLAFCFSGAGATFFVTTLGLRKIGRIASKHSLAGATQSAITENIFECLQYLD